MWRQCDTQKIDSSYRLLGSCCAHNFHSQYFHSDTGRGAEEQTHPSHVIKTTFSTPPMTFLPILNFTNHLCIFNDLNEWRRNLAAPFYQLLKGLPFAKLNLSLKCLTMPKKSVTLNRSAARFTHSGYTFVAYWIDLEVFRRLDNQICE